MPELLGALGGYAGTMMGLGGGMPELLCAQGGYAGTFDCSVGGMPELLWAQGGGMPELFWAQWGVCRNFLAGMAWILATRCPRLTGISGLGTQFINVGCVASPHVSRLRRLGLNSRNWVRNASYSSTGDSSPKSDDCPPPPPPLLVLRYCYH